MRATVGAAVILTADRVLFGDYPTLLDGMMAAALTTRTPGWLMRRTISRPVCSVGVRAVKAPLGLRAVEAELLARGLGAGEVACVAPERLEDAAGPATRAVLISSGDPLGIGMNDSTMSGLGGGEPWPKVWFASVMRRIRALKARYPGLTVMAGGPGAWQLAQHPAAAAELGIDSVFEGYAEGRIAPWVEKMRAGETLPRHIAPDGPAAARRQSIAGASSMGVVEVSRGCGLGCEYCTMGAHRMVHFPAEQVARDVRTNVSGGVREVVLAGEDFFRYGADGPRRLRPEAVLDLVRAVRGVPGARLVQVDHANVSSVARFPEDALRELVRVMKGRTGQRWVWLNLGVETASARLMAESGSGGKLAGLEADWAGACDRAVRRLTGCGVMPMVSLMFGLRGETRADLAETFRLVRGWRGLPVLVFPLFMAPVAPGEPAFGVGDMRSAHWKVLKASYGQNNVWLPRLYWDQHTAAGAPAWRRLFIQAGGRAKVLEWTLRFAWLSGELG